jgi:hypothetical protein
MKLNMAMAAPDAYRDRKSCNRRESVADDKLSSLPDERRIAVL